MAKILIVDDEETIRKLLTASLERRGHTVCAAVDGEQGAAVYADFMPDAVVSDIKMPKLNGFQMLESIQAKFGEVVPVIFITGHGEKSAAIESLRKGAFDYLEKPFDMEEFSHTLDSALEKRRLTQELAEARKKLEDRLEARTELVQRITRKDSPKVNFSLAGLGQASAMQPLKESIASLTKNPIGSTLSVLLTGPSGAGKEVVARTIHETSARAQGPWVAVNCGALPENLIESELFGHEKGSFSGATQRRLGLFELADGGTLFLDEIGELPLHLQSKLLRVLQERNFRRIGGTSEIHVDVRVIAATNKDLKQEIQNKNFREDLYYRLNTVHMDLPTLDMRKEDIPMLAKVLLKDVTNGQHSAPKDFFPEALAALATHSWPGNIRELKSCIQRAAMFASGDMISAEVIQKSLGKNVVSFKPELIPVAEGSATNTSTSAAQPSATSSESALPKGISYHRWKKDFMQQTERQFLLAQLQAHQGNVSAIARGMKISRPNLCRLLKKHGLTAENYRKTA